MKYCPICQIKYTDDSLLFCLEDGTRLLSQTNKEREVPTQLWDERETVVRQNRITSGGGQIQETHPAAHQPESKKSNTPLAVILTALTMFVLFAGGVALWLMLKNGGSEGSSNINKSNNSSLPTPRVMITPDANTDRRNRNDNTNPDVSGGTDWTPLNNQASLTGERLTYYRGTTAEQCKEDCDKNPKCKAFGLIKAGAYNPADPPMCYLLSKATEIVTHSCCISAIKASETLKACEIFLSAGLYDKWKRMGGENGNLGCPTTGETETEISPQGTTGRMTQFSKGDGGYIIRHDTGRFSGTSFEVSGCIFKIYASIGNTKSWLGFPVKDGYTTPTGARQDFEGGYILWDSKTYKCQAYEN